uniref:Uncharacterized protein n=1 Tax=Anguilla anguilla TaxID=7936 RepID=A0A0E9WY06_ANGAN
MTELSLYSGRETVMVSRACTRTFSLNISLAAVVLSLLRTSVPGNTFLYCSGGRPCSWMSTVRKVFTLTLTKRTSFNS